MSKLKRKSPEVLLEKIICYIFWQIRGFLVLIFVFPPTIKAQTL